MIKLLNALLLILGCFLLPMATAAAAELQPPAGVKWGSTPQAIAGLWPKILQISRATSEIFVEPHL